MATATASLTSTLVSNNEGPGATSSPVSHGFSNDCWSKTNNDCSTHSMQMETDSPSRQKLVINPSHCSPRTSAALDTLAILASTAQKELSSSTIAMDDSSIMPPPPPRIKGRMRSASNPEGMEKWDSYSYFRNGNLSSSSLSSPSSWSSRRHFVLPTSILEEELAEANETCKIFAEQKQLESSSQLAPSVKRGMTVFGINQLSPERKKRGKKKLTKQHKDDSNDNSNDEESWEPLEDESNLDPEELLRRARNRLFEDLACSDNCGLEKGVIPLPHSLEKYKEVRAHNLEHIIENTTLISIHFSFSSMFLIQIYNKNGRIGIYTPAERAAIIAKFNSKRSKRVWNKKIRYNCRKNLADRRMRVKGRFVKRTVEHDSSPQKQEEGTHVTDSSSSDQSSSSSSRTTSPVPSAPPSGPLKPVLENCRLGEESDEDMPDVHDPEAGFKPTLNQPYRRTRRHTIT